jgi:hypothetical protein
MVSYPVRQLHGLNKAAAAQIAVAGIHLIEIQPLALPITSGCYVKPRQKFHPQSQPFLRL